MLTKYESGTILKSPGNHLPCGKPASSSLAMEKLRTLLEEFSDLRYAKNQTIHA